MVTTNSDEGALFVTSDVLIASNFTLSQYITELFSRLSQKSIQEAVRLYSSLPLNSVPDQASAVMGDCQFSSVSKLRPDESDTNNLQLSSCVLPWPLYLLFVITVGR